MQIHELNNFTGTLGSGSFLAVDNGTDTGKVSTQQLLAATEARIDNIIAGPAPSAEEIVDARRGADGVPYPSLGDAIRDQFTDLKSDLNDLAIFGAKSVCPIYPKGTFRPSTLTVVSDGKGSYNISGTASGGNVHFNLFSDSSAFPTGISAGDRVLGYVKSTNTAIKFMVIWWVGGTKMEDDATHTLKNGYKYFDIPSNATGMEIRITVPNGTATNSDVVIPFIFVDSTKYGYDNEIASLDNQIDFIDGQIADIESNLEYKYEPVEITTEAGIYDTTNNITTGTGYIHTIVSVIKEEKYKISSYKFSSSYPAVLFRKDGVLLSYNNTPSSGKFAGLEVTVPDGANEMLINGEATNGISVDKLTLQEMASKAEVITKDYGAYIYNDQSVILTSGIMDTAGNITNAGQYTSISVSEGERYIGIVYVWGSTSYPVYLFRKNGNVVSYLNKTGTMYEFEVTIPSGVDEMVVNTNNNFMVIKKGAMISSKPYSKWHGKKIAWFGTSIPETSMYNAVLGYPEYVGNLLGATVYNEARGSSCARRGFKSAQSANDPYGWTGMGYKAALYNMGSTHTEKQDMLDNWDSKWKALVGGDHTLTEDDRTFAMYYSYETVLQQHIDSPVDLYVFDHGYNDWSSNPVDMAMNENDPYDRSTYQGAMNTFIKLILTANPRAKILLVSHYETQERPTLVPMQKAVAEYWNLPFCEICNYLGWANDRTITTDGYWSNGTGNGIWIASGGTEHTYTLKQLHIPDGRHPNIDISGHACMDIANIIADFINTITPTD